MDEPAGTTVSQAVDDAGAQVTAPPGPRRAFLDAAADVARRAGGSGADADLLAWYVEGLADEDLVSRDPVDAYGLVVAHRDLARRRPPRRPNVRVFTPDVRVDGWTTGHTAVQVVTDDMPFLVDSVTNEISRAGRGIHLVVHPQLVVRRGPGGELVEVVGVTRGEDRADLPEGTIVESWIHVDVDRSDSSETDEALEASLIAVLGDVRRAVEDWQLMRATALGIADGMDHTVPTGVHPDDAAEAARLLRWLVDGHFTFLGYREYALDPVSVDAPAGAAATLRSVPGSGLGILREAPGDRPSETVFRGTLAERARRPNLLIVTKANSRATVHRVSYLDYIGLKTFDAHGRVVGERRFLGLLSSAAYTQSVAQVPVVDRKVRAVMAASGYGPRTHSGKALMSILETYPRDELFASDVDTLIRISTGVQLLQERRRTRLFVRPDDYGRFVSCLVYLPRDRYTTAVRLAIQSVLTEAFAAVGIEHSSLVGESVLARLHFVVRLGPGAVDEDGDLRSDAEGRPDIDEIERRVAACTRTWQEDLADGLHAELGEANAVRMGRRWADALPEGYKEDVAPRYAVGDLVRLEALEAGHGAAPDLDLMLYHAVGAPEDESRLKLYRRDPLSLSVLLPYFDNLGVEVVDQRPYHLDGVGAHDGTGGPHTGSFWIYDLGVRLPRVATDPGTTTDIGRLAARFTDAFVAGWTGLSESDRYDRLVLRAGLTWRQVDVLRTYGRYLRQTGTAFSDDYIAEALALNPEVARLLVNVFETRFHPDRFSPAPGGHPSPARTSAQVRAADAVRSTLDDVVSLSHDRILRSLLGCVESTLRTNFYRPGPDGRPNPTIAIKLDPAGVPGLPEPRPAFEIWVCGPRVEGVHLRFGPVARGGLRWSDRREDFRTEVLGLVKAQQVKNAVIVPTGAKGGFVAKQLPDPAADRDAWYAEGVAAYRTFVSAMLDVTDNRDLTAGPAGAVVPPPGVVRHDGDDPYLVVAADKGTAAFSDIANEISTSRGFWLGDAFASGGSHGYDHKAMGITARGAWESVRRHFHDIGLDVASDTFTVVGIGDMSGDVFGNGMLLSRGIRLVAAFDHRHVFVDPDPDPERSFAERRRLSMLARSSWDDYDRAAMSPGGGVFRRDAKAVHLAAPAARALGLALPVGASELVLSPTDLVRGVLAAPVDLLWNGGVGTFVKASNESHADVGDKSNDALRIDATELRARVVGEGGNLGLTQRARVEAASRGTRLNTDAIDNSAGVDCSDHEVNVKILLDRVVVEGDLTAKQRDELLTAMTDDVAASVLRHNVDQNTMLGTARAHARPMVSVHRRLLRWLGEHGGLDRDLEYLPSDDVLDERQAAGQGLVGPELAVVAAYVKLSLTEALRSSAVPDEPWTVPILTDYFPPQLRERYPDQILAHPLRREIVATRLANRVVDTAGTTFVFRLAEELSVPADRAVRAWAVAAEVFDLDGWSAAVDAQSAGVPSDQLDALRLTHRRLLDRAARWFLQSRPDPLDVAAEVQRFRPTVENLGPRLWEVLRRSGRDVPAGQLALLVGAGVPEALARRSLELLDEFDLLDITEIAARTGEPAESVLEVYTAVDSRYSVDSLLVRISQLPRGDRWQALARGALRYDVYAAVEALTTAVVRTVPHDIGLGAAERVERWEQDNAAVIERARRMFGEIESLTTDELAPLLVALRTLRSLVTSGTAEGPR